MTTRDRWRRIQDQFAELKAASAGRRAAALRELARGDAEAASELRRLLGDYDSLDGDFLTPPPRPELPATNPLDGGPDDPGANADDPLIDQRVGEFHILRLIARGGMGSVYLADQAHPRRRVALKLLHSQLLSSAVRTRFAFETDVLARLQHPNVAQVHQVGEHQGRPYFAMEYVNQARPITDYAEQQQLSLRDRLQLYCQLCEAVQYGHRRGVIHRDLKPGNILVSAGEKEPRSHEATKKPPSDEATEPRSGQCGTGVPPVDSLVRDSHLAPIEQSPVREEAVTRPIVKVIDFGVARATDADVTLVTQHTEAGQLIGTLQYMSPEQCAGDSHEVDVRSDVYSLGVVMYELLCDRLPYDVGGASIATAARIVCEAEPPRPSAVTSGRAARASRRSVVGGDRGSGSREQWGSPTVAPSSPLPAPRSPLPVKGDLEHIILTALAKDPATRYQSVVDLLRDIRHFLSGEPIEAKRPTLWTRILHWALRHPVKTTAAFCATIALAVLALTIYVKQHYVNWYLDKRPYDVRLSPDGAAAYLFSLSDRILHRWPTQRTGDGFALFAERPARFGGGRIALVPGIDPHDRHASSLNAYDVDTAPGVVIWALRVETNEVLPELREFRGVTGRDFDPLHGWLLDVFPDDKYPQHPGDEIVVTFAFGRSSGRVLRVYDLAGNGLYEVWHDGAISSVCMLRDQGLLIFGGDYHLPHWNYKSYPPNPKGPKTKDFVVFALRPEPLHIDNTAWLPHTDGAPPASPVWYRRLQPDESLTYVEMVQVAEPPGQVAGLASVEVSIHFFSQPGQRTLACSLQLDAKGNIVPDSQGAIDAYHAERMRVPEADSGRLPDPGVFRFDPMPGGVRPFSTP
jgi:serine/threonine protein kinase